jgi:hypothetical protein
MDAARCSASCQVRRHINQSINQLINQESKIENSHSIPRSMAVRTRPAAFFTLNLWRRFFR